jgi:hypothetical protein
MPGETKQDIEDARINLRKIKTNWFNIACASPLVGSDMHALALENNFITGETLGADYHHAVINTDEFSAEYIQRMQYIMNLELNFVYNQDMIAGSYENALLGFNNVIKVRPDHAIAYYFGAICHKRLGNMVEYDFFRSKFEKFSGHDDWSKWIEFFGLNDLEVEQGHFATEPSLNVDQPNSF